MECGLQGAIMISVPPSVGAGDTTVAQQRQQQSEQSSLVTTIFPPAASSATAVVVVGGGGGGGGGGDSSSTAATDQAQFEADKRAVYKHPLFPLLALLFERCELATQSPEPQSSDAFNMDIQAFVQHQERDRKPFLANEPEIDGLMIKAIQVLRIHLLELEKVQELCKDFCNRYITCLKGKMQSENLLRSDYPQGGAGGGGAAGLLVNLENNNNNSMMSHHGGGGGGGANSDSGNSDSNSPIQYSISPSTLMVTSSQTISEQRQQLVDGAGVGYGGGIYDGPTPPPLLVNQTTTTAHHNHHQGASVAPSCDVGGGGLVVHGSTPLSQIGANLCSVPPSDSSGPLSPSPTTPGGSADDCDSDFTSRGGATVGTAGGRKQKRGVLPKHATSVMRSWLFQHLVHPYPTEDEKRHIAAQTNLTLLQVNNWFINARRRILQPMLDASAPPSSDASASSPNNRNHHKKKTKSHQNNNRRFWPQDFANMQPQIDGGMLSSSDDDDEDDEECDSYSSEGEDGAVTHPNAAASVGTPGDGGGGGGGGGGGVGGDGNGSSHGTEQTNGHRQQ